MGDNKKLDQKVGHTNKLYCPVCERKQIFKFCYESRIRVDDYFWVCTVCQKHKIYEQK